MIILILNIIPIDWTVEPQIIECELNHTKPENLGGDFGWTCDIHTKLKQRVSNQISSVYGETEGECIRRANLIIKAFKLAQWK